MQLNSLQKCTKPSSRHLGQPQPPNHDIRRSPTNRGDDKPSIGRLVGGGEHRMHASEEAQGSNYWLDFWLDQRSAGVTYVPVAKAASLYVFVAPAATYAFVAPAATYVPVAFVSPQHMCSSPRPRRVPVARPRRTCSWPPILGEVKLTTAYEGAPPVQYWVVLGTYMLPMVFGKGYMPPVPPNSLISSFYMKTLSTTRVFISLPDLCAR